MLIRIFQKAIDEQVDFIIHGGDFFHDNNVGPDTLSAVFKIFKMFRDQCDSRGLTIPFIVIEGNHDTRRHGQARSWLKFLADRGLIHLLSVPVGEIRKKRQVVFVPYSREHAVGGKICIKDAVIYGMQYFGSSTPSLLPMIEKAIDANENKFSILLLHSGISGQMEDEFGVEHDARLEKLHEKIDYLALGHFHKRFILTRKDPWIFNPGSLEITNARHVFRGHKHGAYIVEVFGMEPHERSFKILESVFGSAIHSDEIPTRSFFRLPRAIDFTNVPINSFDELCEYVVEYLKKSGLKERVEGEKIDFKNPEVPVALVSLSGRIPFSKFDVNHRILKKIIKDSFETVHVEIYSFLESAIDGITIAEGEEKDITEIEREVLLSIISEFPKYEPIKEEITSLMQDLKDLLIKGNNNAGQVKDIIKTWWMAKRGKNMALVEQEEEADPELDIDQEFEEQPDTPVAQLTFDDFSDDEDQVYDDGSD